MCLKFCDLKYFVYICINKNTMKQFLSTYTLDFNNLTVTDKYVDSDWDELICEHEGCFSSSDQYITFDCDGVEVCVNFELCVSGHVIYDAGDYWTPPYSETEISDVDIDITSVLIDDYELSLDSELKSSFNQIVRKVIM